MEEIYQAAFNDELEKLASGGSAITKRMRSMYNINKGNFHDRMHSEPSKIREETKRIPEYIRKIVASRKNFDPTPTIAQKKPGTILKKYKEKKAIADKRLRDKNVDMLVYGNK